MGAALAAAGGLSLASRRAAAGAAARPATRRRRRTPRAVVRWRFIKLRFALEGRHPSTLSGRISCAGRVHRGVRLRFTLLAAAALAVAAPAQAANPQAAGLQVALRAQGLYRGPIDALTGPGTVAAVRAFQRQQGLPPTGRADLRTRVALGPFGRPLYGARALRRGMFGWDVSVLQWLLVRQGLASPINGYFDAPTARALRVYQARLNLSADAVAGPATLLRARIADTRSRCDEDGTSRADALHREGRRQPHSDLPQARHDGSRARPTEQARSRARIADRHAPATPRGRRQGARRRCRC